MLGDAVARHPLESPHPLSPFRNLTISLSEFQTNSVAQALGSTIRSCG